MQKTMVALVMTYGGFLWWQHRPTASIGPPARGIARATHFIPFVSFVVPYSELLRTVASRPV